MEKSNALSGLKRKALMSKLIRQMDNNQSWNGETHIQKTAYFLEEALGVPLDYSFTLYWYGPYSFDLHDELLEFQAKNIVNVIPNTPYGASFHISPNGEALISRFPKTVAEYERQIDFVSSKIATKSVVELERLSTALYVEKRFPELREIKDKVGKISELKRHIAPKDAEEAIQEVRELLKEAYSVSGR